MIGLLIGFKDMYHVDFTEKNLFGRYGSLAPRPPPCMKLLIRNKEGGELYSLVHIDHVLDMVVGPG